MFALILALILSIPACATEDSNMCYWDADTQGNGTGNSFVAVSDDIIIYF